MRKLYILLFVICSISLSVQAQTTYLPLGTDEYHLLDRIETLNGELNPYFVSSLKPISRKEAMSFLQQEHKATRFGGRSYGVIDQYNMERALSISGEWVEQPDGDDGAINSRRPVLRYFYRKQPDLLHVNTDDFFLVVNPVLYLQVMSDHANNDATRYINTRGAEVRGRIMKRIGFYTMLADNQEKLPSYMDEWQLEHDASPGYDYYVRKSGGLNDIFLARGYFDFNAFNDHLNVTFGYDKNFVGDGMRSLLLSDVGAPATFLRLRSRIGKLNYENLFLELTNDYTRGGDRQLPQKYATMHQLNMNVTPWLNVGIFESSMFGNVNKFPGTNLIPVIFYQTLARSLGAAVKTAAGINFKAVALHSVQVYGQGYFNSLDLGTMSKGGGKNQFGIQLGAKYFDAFTLPNLDLQGELNLVRPFTYGAKDTVTNYTHYNQALAHPMESSFAEVIFAARYQPVKRMTIQAKGIYTSKRSDAMLGTGNDIFTPFVPGALNNNYSITGSNPLSSLYMNLHLNYEIRPNIFLEAGASHLQRSYNVAGPSIAPATLLYGAVRWNIARREYDYF